jgi:hypothetical protein
MRLRIVHCDPEQTERVRAWFLEHPGYELFRDTGHVMWRLSDGEQEIVGYSWSDSLDHADDEIAGRPQPGFPGMCGPPPQPGRQCQRPEPEVQ